MNRKATRSLFLMACILIDCGNFKDPDPHYTYAVPNDPEEGLSISSLSVEGVNEAPITEVTDLIIREKYKRVDGLLILRHNRLIYENYFHGYSKDVMHNLYSAGKSITSLLAGIAIDKGFIDNVDVPILDLLPEYKNIQNPDPRKQEITIKDLLNMSSGLDCDDWYQFTESHMQESSDWVKFTLDLPMVNDPGATGSYCTGGVVTLGRIIENASGMSLEEFASQFLYKPLNITTWQWHRMPDGRASGGGLFFLRPRDMAKIGLLMLNKGIWNDKQIVSPEWVTRCSEDQVKMPGPFDGYGYLWWKQSFTEEAIETYFADGNGGQQIFVIPSKDMVLVFTGGNKNTGIGQQNFQIVNDYILPATN